MSSLRRRHTHPLSLVAALLAALLAVSAGGTAFGDAADAHIPPPRDTPYPGTIRLAVNATDTTQGIFRVHELIPVRPGKLILLYPKWIPGEHAPAGPINRLAGLEITANGRRLMWHRYKYDVYAFRVDVPQGATHLGVNFQFLSGRGKTAEIDMTNKMLDLDWNDVSLYPAGHYSRDITFAPGITLPAGWQFGTALEAESHSGNTWNFKPTTYNTLVDSPVYAGKYFKRVNLDPGGKVPVHLDIVADSPKDLVITPHELQVNRNLVTQAYKLFHSQHYKHYDFLFSLSDQMSGNGGLEHHQSSEDRYGPTYFTDWADNAPVRDLLAHEYTHSWNGKFRRPADLWTPNFNVPMGDSLLWVYEGLTEYYGSVLTARSGMWTPEQFRQSLALVAANHDVDRPGLAWRTLEGTTNSPILGGRGKPYLGWQLGREEYYEGGQLIWLAVDCKIRSLTHDRKSLDTFAKDFFGIDNGSLVTRTYTFDDIVNALNGVVKYDWARFLRGYLDTYNPPLPGAVQASGWKLVFIDKESRFQKDLEAFGYPPVRSNFAYSIGLTLTRNGGIQDVRWNGPAFKAGIGSHGTLVAVDGHHYSGKVLKQAITAAKDSKQPIELMIDYLGDYRTVPVDYHGGLKYPHLVRVKSMPDYLDRIIKAK